MAHAHEPPEGSVSPRALPPPVFEGSEKRLSLRFARGVGRASRPRRDEGLRLIPRAELDLILADAECLIVSAVHHEAFDAYVLSESSLFVYADEAVVKTCGTTKLLACVPRLVRAAADSASLRPDSCRYSRASYLFPSQQPAPHTGFAHECQALVDSLPELDARSAHVMGDELDGEGLRWHIFEAHRSAADAVNSSGDLEGLVDGVDTRRGRPEGPDSAADEGADARAPRPTHRSLEICCTGLDPRRAARFAGGALLSGDTPAAAARRVTRATGIGAMIPRFAVDDYAFDPCGYSMNAALGGAFSTVHVTPEEHCSYASFELTGLEGEDGGLDDGAAGTADLLARASRVFAPERMVVARSARGDAGGAWGAPPAAPAGYRYASSGAVSLRAGGHVCYFSLVRTVPSHRVPDVEEDVKRAALAEAQALAAASRGAAGKRERPESRPDSPCGVVGALADSAMSEAPARREASPDGDAFAAPAASPAVHVAPERPCPRSVSSSPPRVPTPVALDPPSRTHLRLRTCAEALRAFGALPIAHGAEALDAAVRAHARAHSLDDTFWLVDLGATERRFREWVRAMPLVRPHYAVKALPDSGVLAVLAALGAGFDCASAAELDAVCSLGVAPRDIVLANACKRAVDLRAAASRGVAATTFDSVAEVDKVAALHPGAAVLLRIRADAEHARCPLGSKYGAEPDEWAALLDAAVERHLDVAGVAFHVGSGAAAEGAPAAFERAIALARLAWDQCLARGLRPRVLDIGGGFPGGDMPDAIPRAVNAALRRHFGDELRSSVSGLGAAADALLDAGAGSADPEPDVRRATATQAALAADDSFRVIAEPGRFFAERSAALATSVFGVRERGGIRELWLSDGLYGAMNSILYDGAKPLPRALPADPRASPPVCRTTLFGPTCDGLDTVATDVPLPRLAVGDWVAWHDMGAYTLCGACKFNGIDAVDVPRFYLASADEAS